MPGERPIRAIGVIALALFGAAVAAVLAGPALRDNVCASRAGGVLGAVCDEPSIKVEARDHFLWKLAGTTSSGNVDNVETFVQPGSNADHELTVITNANRKDHVVWWQVESVENGSDRNQFVMRYREYRVLSAGHGTVREESRVVQLVQQGKTVQATDIAKESTSDASSSVHFQIEHVTGPTVVYKNPTTVTQDNLEFGGGRVQPSRALVALCRIDIPAGVKYFQPGPWVRTSFGWLPESRLRGSAAAVPDCGQWIGLTLNSTKR